MTKEAIAEEPKKIEENKTVEEHPGLAHLSEDDRQEVLALRKEAADRRVKAKEIEAKYNELIQKQKEADEAKLKEDGKLKELLEAKEAELSALTPLKEKVENYEKYFTEQLEEALKKLTETQRELINDTDMEVSKKLKWALKLQQEGAAQVATPDGARPGGKAPLEKINIADYSGPEGRKKLVELFKTNKPLYDAIVKEKNNK